MAQMPIQSLAGRADPFVPAAVSARPPAPPPGAYIIDKSGISGGLLRPGAMDQAQFKALLAAARAKPETPPPAAAPPGILTLSPAQLAALGAFEEPDVTEPAAVPASAIPTEPAPLADPAPDSADTQPASQPASPPDSRPDLRPAATGGPMPRARLGADGVWELPRLPDKDERDMLRGQKWRLVEDPEATRLFLGEDGKFGWDDFVDLINPLQHIPLVNVAYRAITGDEINGAARLVDFAFGPLAGVSTAIDLAFRSTTGQSMADNAVAALFGGEESGDARAAVSTASGTQLADTGLIRRGSHR